MKKLTDSADIGKHRIVKRKYWMQLTAMMLSFMMIACSMPECSAFSEKAFASEIQDAEFQDTEPLDSDVFEELPESMAADAVENQDDQMELPASPESQEGQMEVPADTDAEIRNGEIEAPAGADGDEAAEASFYDEQSSWTGQDESELAGEQPADSTYSGESASQNAEIPAEVDSTNEFLPEEAPAEGDLSEELPTDNLPAEGFTDEIPQEYTSPSDQIFEAVPEETPVPDPEIEADVEGSAANPETSVEPDPFLSEDAAIEESAEVKKDATVRSGYCGDNVTWNLDDSGNLLISGEGSMYDYASKASPFYMMSEITSINIEEGVTDIGDYAFNGCSELRKVQLPLSIVRIGTGAFMDCTCLTDIYYAGSKRNWNTIAGSDDCLSSGASLYPAIESEEISIPCVSE